MPKVGTPKENGYEDKNSRNPYTKWNHLLVHVSLLTEPRVRPHCPAQTTITFGQQTLQCNGDRQY
jgi:hypothetical protein